MNTENQRLERENILYATKSISDPGEHPEAHIQLTFINQLLCAKCWIKKGIYLPEGSKVIYLERSCRIRTLLSGTYTGIIWTNCPVTYIVLPVYIVDLPVSLKAVNSLKAGHITFSSCLSNLQCKCLRC